MSGTGAGGATPRSRIHGAAAKGFTRGADAYERGRPTYPPDAVAFVTSALGIGPGQTVVDVGAGTGKFTSLLVPTGARVVAVEPVEAMRHRLEALVPGAEAFDGTAEALPLADGEADGLTVAQAFHWVRHQAALAEFARVLRRAGGLALVWNSRDTSVPWVAELNRTIRWNAGQIPTYDAGDERWIDVVAGSGRFTPLEMRSFRNEQQVDVPTLLDRVASTSYIATMDPDERASVLDDVRAIVSGFPEHFVLPHVTYVYWCTKRS
jgi:SAM-dependent methyltransferase